MSGRRERSATPSCGAGERRVERRRAAREEHAAEEHACGAAPASGGRSPGSRRAGRARPRTRPRPARRPRGGPAPPRENAVRAPARRARQPNQASSASGLPRRAPSQSSNPPTRSNSSRSQKRLAHSYSPVSPTTQTVRSKGPGGGARVGVHGALDQVRGLERRDPGREPAGRRNAVGVGEGERPAGGNRRARVARRARPQRRPRAPARTAIGAASATAAVASRGAVVDHDHLELDARLLGGQPGERRAEGRGGVARGDDDARGDHGADKLAGPDTATRVNEMREFWDARAAEDAFYFVDNRLAYGAPTPRLLGAAARARRRDPRAARRRRSSRRRAGRDRLRDRAPDPAARARGAQVRALDVSPRMLDLAREHNPGLANVEWVLGDGARWPDRGPQRRRLLLARRLSAPARPGDRPRLRPRDGPRAEAGRLGGVPGLQRARGPPPPAARPARPRVGWTPPAAAARAARATAPGGDRPSTSSGSRAVAAEVGLEVERTVGAGTQFCFVRLLRAQPSASA